MNKPRKNGQQAGKDNVQALEQWVSSHESVFSNAESGEMYGLLESITPFIRGGILNRSKLAAKLGFARSSFGSNQALLTKLLDFENDLRRLGVLPDLTEAGISQSQGDVPTQRQVGKGKARMTERRASELEVENLELRARIKELESGMSNLRELAEALSELGVIKS